MGPAWRRSLPLFCGFTECYRVCDRGAFWPADARRIPVTDLLYIGYIVVGFAVLWLLVKGVERFER